MENKSLQFLKKEILLLRVQQFAFGKHEPALHSPNLSSMKGGSTRLSSVRMEHDSRRLGGLLPPIPVRAFGMPAMVSH
jgi:hypothetical protein